MTKHYCDICGTEIGLTEGKTTALIFEHEQYVYTVRVKAHRMLKEFKPNDSRYGYADNHVLICDDCLRTHINYSLP